MELTLMANDVLNDSTTRHPEYDHFNGSNDTVITVQPHSLSVSAVPITYQQYAINITYIVVSLFGLIGNLLALSIIFTHPPIRKRIPNYYFINQTIVDFLVSIILVPAITKGIVPSFYSTTPVCLLWQSRAIFLSLYMVSVYSIVALSFERYLEIVHPIWHKLNVTKQKILGTIAIVWFICFTDKFAFLLSTTRAVNGVCSLANFYPSVLASSVAGLINCFLDFIFPIFVISFCYIQMWRSLQKKVRPEPPNLNVLGAGTTKVSTSLSRARKNILVTLVIVVMCFVICTTYKQVLLVLKYLYIVPLDLSSVSFNVSQIMAFVNATIEPYVYLLYHKEFQNGFRKLFRFKNLGDQRDLDKSVTVVTVKTSIKPALPE